MPVLGIKRFSQACHALYAPGLHTGNFAARAFAFLRTLVPAEFIACGVLEPRRQRLTIGFDTPHPGFASAMETFGSLMGNYTLYNWNPATNDGRPFCRSHFYTAREFRNLDIYREVYRPLGIDNHCAVHVPAGPHEIMFFGIERARGPDFSSDELASLELAQMHLADAHALCRAQAEQVSAPIAPALLVLAGLTPREADTLFWLTEGKSNQEIALLLRIGVHTVKAHLASIFNKIGVGNRVAAILWARRLAHTTTAPAGFIDVTARLNL